MIIIPNMRQQDLTALGQKLVADINSTIIEIGHRTVKTTVTIGATLVNASAPDTNSIINRVIQAIGMAIVIPEPSIFTLIPGVSLCLFAYAANRFIKANPHV